MSSDYPPSAYSPDGTTLWWHLEYWPGTKRTFGGERKLAAYLYFAVKPGETFTMRKLRTELGSEAVPEDDEHLNRRLRELRKDGFVINSYRDRNLPNDTYQLESAGQPIGLEKRARKSGVTAKVRRQVLDRDGSRCLVCGIGRGEAYHKEPGTRAVITMGHRIPIDRGGTDDLDNLRAECSRCNEPVRQTMPDPEKLDEVWAAVRELPRSEAGVLVRWLETGERPYNKVTDFHDRVLGLAPSEQEEIVGRLHKKVDS